MSQAEHLEQFARACRERYERVDVLVNTYWVRFNCGGFTRAEGVTNTLRLFASV